MRCSHSRSSAGSRLTDPAQVADIASSRSTSDLDSQTPRGGTGFTGLRRSRPTLSGQSCLRSYLSSDATRTAGLASLPLVRVAFVLQALRVDLDAVPPLQLHLAGGEAFRLADVRDAADVDLDLALRAASLRVPGGELGCAHQDGARQLLELEAIPHDDVAAGRAS